MKIEDLGNKKIIKIKSVVPLGARILRNEPVEITLSEDYLRIKLNMDYICIKKVDEYSNGIETTKEVEERSYIKEHSTTGKDEVKSLCTFDQMHYSEEEEVIYYSVGIDTEGSSIKISSSKEDRDELHKILIKWKYNIDEEEQKEVPRPNIG